MSIRGTGPDVSDGRTEGEAAREPSGLRARLYRARERVRARPLLNTAWRAAVFTVGWLIVLGGIFMLVFPGPGWVTIFIGFAILATEFVWARKALHKAKSVAAEASRRALDPRTRRRNQIIAGAVTALVIVGCGLYVWRYGLPFAAPFALPGGVL
ncbi:MAG: TIGR02611 family protein [Streptosporangiaceae bacterium]